MYDITLNPKFKKRYPKHQGKVEIQPYSGYFWARKKEKKKEEQKKKTKKTRGTHLEIWRKTVSSRFDISSNN